MTIYNLLVAGKSRVNRIVHLSASLIVLTCLVSSMLASLVVEHLGNAHSLAWLKDVIVFPGLVILITASVAMSGSGFVLASGRHARLIEKKKKRMMMIAAIAIGVLLPSALVLRDWATAGSFGLAYHVLQSGEYLAGGLALFLICQNIRDGLRLSGRMRR